MNISIVYVKSVPTLGELAALEAQVNKMGNKQQETSNFGFDIHPDEFGGEDYPHDFKEEFNFFDKQIPLPLNIPLVSEEEASVIKKFYNDHPNLQGNSNTSEGYTFNPHDPWIQTYSGRRFTPTNPSPDAIVIEDIAHALSMQCRFGGHIKSFYSVAQHCVLVSYICNFEDAFWGLMHDASEAYLIDLPRPLKHSGKLDAYIEFEGKVQAAICKRYDLAEKEPASIKKADTILLVTEARDLLPNKRSDWTLTVEPLPFKINPLGPREAKDLFMKRFYELTNMPGAYEHYLHYENQK